MVVRTVEGASTTARVLRVLGGWVMASWAERLEALAALAALSESTLENDARSELDDSIETVLVARTEMVWDIGPAPRCKVVHPAEEIVNSSRAARLFFLGASSTRSKIVTLVSRWRGLRAQRRRHEELVF
jgi:hypothetical protein